MNTQDRHTAATAKIDDLERRFDKLFNECQAECDGMSIDDSNKVWADKYQSRYEAMERLCDAAYNCYWFSSPDIPTQTKRIVHRHTVAKMRAAGLHRMDTVSK